MSQLQRTAIHVLHADQVVMQTLLDFLSYLGYWATPLRSADELLASLEAKHQKADVVVAKLEMAGKAGRDILRAVHERHPNVAFMLITDAFGSLPAAEAVSCGVYAYLREPIQLCELELSLARLGECNSLARLCESKLLFAPSTAPA
jgi:DNA-binding NtrC family response regulator